MNFNKNPRTEGMSGFAPLFNVRLFAVLVFFAFQCLGIFPEQIIYGQTPINNAESDQIESLKNSCLIFAISSYRNKIEALNSLLENGQINTEDRQKIISEIAVTERSRDYENALFIEEIIKHLTFCKPLFVYDYELLNIRKGIDSVNLIDEHLKTDYQSLPELYFLALHQKSDPSASTNIHSWKICDQNFEIIPSPFPNSLGLSPIKKFFRSVFTDREIEWQKNAEDISRKINEKFTEYYLKSRAPESN